MIEDNNYIHQKNVISWIVLIYFVLRLFNCLIPVTYIMLVALVAIKALSFQFIPLRKMVKCDVRIVIVFFGVLVSVFFSWCVFGINNLDSLIIASIDVVFGYFMAKFGLNRKTVLLLFAIISVMILGQFIVWGSINMVFLRSSRNNISAFMILTAVLYYSTYRKNENILLIPAIITFLFSCLAQGRSGVISSFVLLAGILFLVVFSKRKLTIGRGVFAILFFVFLIYVIYNYYDLFFSDALTRLNSQRMLENERTSIINDYIRIIRSEPACLLLGVPSNRIPLVEELSGNFHNSFLSLHSTFGLVGFGVVIALIINAIIKCFKNRQWLYLLLLIVLIARIFTDGLCFIGLYDPVVYYIITLCVFNKKERWSSTE